MEGVGHSWVLPRTLHEQGSRAKGISILRSGSLSIAKYSPGHMVVVVDGARKTKACVPRMLCGPLPEPEDAVPQ